MSKRITPLQASVLIWGDDGQTAQHLKTLANWRVLGKGGHVV